MTGLIKRPARVGISLAALGFLVFVSLGVGVADVELSKALSDPDTARLVFGSRVPRTLAAVLAGAGLAIAGLIMQALARNKFVEPSTAGTAQSAALGILLVTLLWPSATLLQKMLVASASALAGTVAFMTIAQRLPPTQPYLMPLFALVFGGVIGAAVTFIGWQTDLYQYVEIWTNGEFSGVLRGRYELLWAAVVIMGLAWWTADRITILSLGKDAAIGLGVSYQRTMQFGLVIVSVLTALTVIVVGMIPFVGLVAPNLVARRQGDDVRSAIPVVALTGAVLVLACDIAGRLMRFPHEIPVGTVVGVVGAAMFLMLLLAPRNG